MTSNELSPMDAPSKPNTASLPMSNRSANIAINSYISFEFMFRFQVANEQPNRSISTGFQHNENPVDVARSYRQSFIAKRSKKKERKRENELHSMFFG